MDKITITQESLDYWKRIQRSAYNYSIITVDELCTKMYSDYHEIIVKYANNLLSKAERQEFEDYLNSEIIDLFNKMETKDKLIFRVSQYYIGDTFNSNQEFVSFKNFVMERLVCSVKDD